MKVTSSIGTRAERPDARRWRSVSKASTQLLRVPLPLLPLDRGRAPVGAPTRRRRRSAAGAKRSISSCLASARRSSVSSVTLIHDSSHRSICLRPHPPLPIPRERPAGAHAVPHAFSPPGVYVPATAHRPLSSGSTPARTGPMTTRRCTSCMLRKTSRRLPFARRRAWAAACKRRDITIHGYFVRDTSRRRHVELEHGFGMSRLHPTLLQ